MIKKYRIAYGVFLFLALLNLLFPIGKFWYGYDFRFILDVEKVDLAKLIILLFASLLIALIIQFIYDLLTKKNE
jgi:hypothetical protein